MKGRVASMFALRVAEVAAVFVVAAILLQQVAWPLWKGKLIFPALRAKSSENKDNEKS